jgi:hypothetical protein
MRQGRRRADRAPGRRTVVSCPVRDAVSHAIGIAAAVDSIEAGSAGDVAHR